MILFSLITQFNACNWQKNNKKIVGKINELIKDISRNRFSGIGKPEPLKYKYKGYWARRIDSEHRLIYQVKADELDIVKCRFHYD